LDFKMQDISLIMDSITQRKFPRAA
jgi:hypothetical protein